MSGPCQMPTETAGIDNLGAVQNVADEVRECNQRLTKAAARANSTALSDCYDADARFIAAGTPTVVGKDGISALCSDFLSRGSVDIAYRADAVWADRELVCTVGTLEMAGRPQRRCIVVYRRDEAGTLRILIDPPVRELS